MKFISDESGMLLRKLLLVLISIPCFLFVQRAYTQEQTLPPEVIQAMNANATTTQQPTMEPEPVAEQQPVDVIPPDNQEQAAAGAENQPPQQENYQATQPQQIPNSQAIAPVSDEASGKISLDIKGMDVIDVLKMLSSRAGINIVIGKNVSGRVTLFLKNVDVDAAFELILLSNDLAYEKKGDILNVMTQRDYELQYGERFQDNKQASVIQLKYAKAVDLSRALTQMKSNIGKIVVDEGSNTVALIDTPEKIIEMETFIKKIDAPVQTKVFSLNYAQAEKLTPKIQEILTKGVGTVRMDERTNKLVVTDYPEKLRDVTNVIDAFDEQTRQVLIDAQIIEIKPSDKFEMGVDWDYWIKSHFKIASALPIGTTGRLILGTPPDVPTKKGDYKAILDILRTIGDTKILSSPRIMALNNQEAKILVGTKDAYITSTSALSGSGTEVSSQTVNFVDVGIKLYVTPTINGDGFVTMKIRPEISSSERTDITSEGKITQVPIVTTSEAETTVMIKDGVTIIIGGLRKDNREKTVKKIPVLGDIPGVGFIFRQTQDTLTKSELVILLTPHIMSPENAFTDFSQAPPQEGAVLRMEKGNIVTETITSDITQKSSTDLSVSEYYTLLSDKINALAAYYRPNNERGKVRVSFIVSKDGHLLGEPKIIKSDTNTLTAFAIAAIRQASPFPPFPRALGKERKQFKVTVAYK